ncbi:hypothetical protein D3C77_557290 [compost metagenome]
MAHPQLAVTPGQQTFGIDALDLVEALAAQCQALARGEQALVTVTADLDTTFKQHDFVVITVTADRKARAQYLYLGLLDIDDEGPPVVGYLDEHLPLHQTELTHWPAQIDINGAGATEQ